MYNERNLIRLWDIAYDGYNGGKDCRCVDWNDTDQRSENPNSTEEFRRTTYDITRAYEVSGRAATCTARTQPLPPPFL